MDVSWCILDIAHSILVARISEIPPFGFYSRCAAPKGQLFPTCWIAPSGDRYLQKLRILASAARLLSPGLRGPNHRLEDSMYRIGIATSYSSPRTPKSWRPASRATVSRAAEVPSDRRRKRCPGIHLEASPISAPVSASCASFDPWPSIPI